MSSKLKIVYAVVKYDIISRKKQYIGKMFHYISDQNKTGGIFLHREIMIKKKGEDCVSAVIKCLDMNYLDKILELEKSIYDDLEDKNYYSCSSRKDYSEIILKKGKVIGCVVKESDELVAMGVYASHGDDEHNYGYDLNVKGEDLLRVGQIESTVVSPEYRGNGLQNIICDILEGLSKQNCDKMIAATVYPENTYSLNTFKKRGYKVMADKLKYGGLRRYVMMKEI